MTSTRFIAASLIALSSLAGTAFAAESAPAVGDVQLQLGVAPSASDRTRAQVQAEYLAARAAGQLPAVGEVSAFAAPSVASARTRAEVRAEYVQARKAGTLPAVGEHV